MVVSAASYTVRMQGLQAFKYEQMPTGEQQRALRRFAGLCRFVYSSMPRLSAAGIPRLQAGEDVN